MAGTTKNPDGKTGIVPDRMGPGSKESRVPSDRASLRGADCEALVLEHYTRVYNFLLWLCGNAQDAEDLCQESFIKVWKNLHRFRRESSTRTWILRIARNTYLDAVRRNHRDCLSRHDAPPPENLADPGALPSELLVRKERSEELVAAVSRLSEPIRTAVILHYREELSYRQLARAMEVPVGTAKYRVSEGLCQLREILGREGENP